MRGIFYLTKEAQERLGAPQAFTDQKGQTVEIDVDDPAYLGWIYFKCCGMVVLAAPKEFVLLAEVVEDDSAQPDPRNQPPAGALRRDPLPIPGRELEQGGAGSVQSADSGTGTGETESPADT